ncbi:uncharacterized protein [Chanodichthys erythropterus]|uniref:uncharacterized protein n=1 Tax=Chanodichthys erythropterus TaxID=933992 RepID=UPI00351E2EF2
MGNNLSATKYPGYTLVSKDKKTSLVKNEGGEQFVIKKFSVGQEHVLNFFLQLSHPYIVHHKEIIRDHNRLYLVLEHCEGGDLAQKIKHKMEATDTFSENESIFFTACGSVHLGEFGEINEWSSDARTAETKAVTYFSPENLSGKSYDEKSEIWRLGCVIYELCMMKSAFSARSTDETVIKILNSSYEALPETFSEDLRQLVTDTLQMDPKNRPSVSEILTRPFIIKHLHKMSLQTTEELYKTLDALRELADGLETVHFNTTVSSLTGGVVGLAGGITSVFGVVLAPLIVTGVGIGVSVAGEVTAGVSNITNMVKQCLNRQKIKMIIKEFQEKIISTICCIQNIHIAMETLESVFPMKRRPCSNPHAWAKTELGQSLRVIPEILRLHEVANVRKVAAQAERAVRVAEAATRILSALFVAVDVFFVFLDSREIHSIRHDCALKESQRETESTSKQTTFSTDQTSEPKDTTNLLSSEQELKSETMKFVTKIKKTTEELQVILDTLRDALHPN